MSLASEPMDIATQLTGALSDLDEKRTSTRIAALKVTIKLLSLHYMYDIEKKVLDWILALKRSIKKDGAETVLAAKLLAILYITVGSTLNLYKDIHTLLLNAINAGNDNVKCAVSCE